jgi:Cu/Ag efflux pump CusA
MVSSTALTLVVIPVIYFVVKGFALRRRLIEEPVSLGTSA